MRIRHRISRHLWTPLRAGVCIPVMPSTHTALDDCTIAVISAPAAKPSSSEASVRTTSAANHGASAIGAAAFVTSTSPSTIIAPPNNDAATGRNLDAPSLIRTAPATPRTYSATTSMSRVNDYTPAMHAAMAGEGIALGWRHVVAGLLEKGLLVRVGDAAVSRERQGCYLVWSSSARLSRQTLAVREWCIECST